MTTDRPTLPPSYWADQCRAELARVQQNACGHGVPHQHCREKHETTTTTTEEATA